MWQFQQAICGLRDACVALGTPIVSGNVSFYNETDGRAIPPTPTVAMIGVLDDVVGTLAPWFRAEGDVVLLLGYTREELDGSEYLAVVRKIASGTPPWIDLDAERRLHRVCLEAAREGLLRTAHDIADGGLAVALAECCMGGPREPLGVRCNATPGIPMAAFLFGESQSRMIVSIRRRHLGALRELAAREGVPALVLGEVRGRRLTVGDVLDVDLQKLRNAWREGLSRRLALQTGLE
jgi:phosphoribosylformylglycinamidine synthase